VTDSGEREHADTPQCSRVLRCCVQPFDELAIRGVVRRQPAVGDPSTGSSDDVESMAQCRRRDGDLPPRAESGSRQAQRVAARGTDQEAPGGRDVQTLTLRRRDQGLQVARQPHVIVPREATEVPPACAGPRLSGSDWLPGFVSSENHPTGSSVTDRTTCSVSSVRPSPTTRASMFREVCRKAGSTITDTRGRDTDLVGANSASAESRRFGNRSMPVRAGSLGSARPVSRPTALTTDRSRDRACAVSPPSCERRSPLLARLEGRASGSGEHTGRVGAVR
jgi:hypothetical protein